MSKVKLVTDTVAQLPPAVAERYEIEVVPAATAMCRGTELTDGIDLTPSTVAGLRASGEKFVTAATNPARLLATFQKICLNTDKIMCITVSSRLSSVHNSAFIAAGQMMRDRPGTEVKLFDSLSAAGAQGLIVIEAAKAAASGATLFEVVAAADIARRRVWSLILLDTLKYVHRTGRIPRIASIAAGTIGVRPLFRLGQDGRINLAGVVRSRQNGLDRVLDALQSAMGSRRIDAFVMHSEAGEEAGRLQEELQHRLNCREVFSSQFSPIMAYGAGPGVVGIAALPVD
ncbi:MAG: DegV family protein [Chloroflexi bacterium]|nr:DegV family protein [Chloroflexota bacterium]